MQLKIYLMLLLTSIIAVGVAAQSWEFKAQAGIYASPVISMNSVYFGDTAGHLYAIDKYSGEEIWNVKLKGAIKSKPAIYGDLVIVYDASGQLSAYNKRHGSLQWKYQMSQEVQVDLWDYYLSSPVLEDSCVYIGSGDGHVYAFKAQTGQLLWRFKTGGVVHASPLIHQDKVLVGSFDGYFYAIDKVSGQLTWRFKTVGDAYFPKGEIQRATCIYKDKVIFGSRDFNIYALDIETGRGHWNYKEPGSWIIASPVAHDNALFFGTSDTHSFCCFNADAGTINWRKQLNMRVYSRAIVDKERIYFGCFNGKVYGVNSKNGATEFEFQTAASKAGYAALFKSETAFADGIELYGADAKTVEEKILKLGAFLSAPIIDGNCLYVGDANGRFYSLELP